MFIENTHLGKYLVDMGTIIAGNKCQKTINIKNICNKPVTFDIESSNYNKTGIHISSTKVVKLAPNDSTSITFTL